MTRLQFSVLMSVYHKEYPLCFKAALQSNLQEQTLFPDEFVLVCDGPLTADLDAVIADYQKRYPDVFKVYRLEQNVGLGKALKFGLQQCRHEFVARSDSDDICASNRFETQIKFLQENPHIDILGSDISEFETDPQSPVRWKRMPCTHEEIAEMAKLRNPINHMSVMFKKAVVEAVGSYIHLPYVEDYYLWVRALCGGARFANIDEFLVSARVGNGMEKRRSNRAYIGSWKELNRYMIKHGMLRRGQYIKNMLLIRAFVYMPSSVKGFVYKYILRKGN